MPLVDSFYKDFSYQTGKQTSNNPRTLTLPIIMAELLDQLAFQESFTNEAALLCTLGWHIYLTTSSSTTNSTCPLCKARYPPKEIQY